MSKTRDTGFLGNVVKVDASGNVSFVSGSTTLATINTSGQLSGSSPVLSASYASNAELLDGLDSTVFTLTSSFNAQTASFTAFSASHNTFTASIFAQTASLNTFSASILSYTSSINAKTASFATTGSNTFVGNQVVSGSIVQSGSFTTTGTIIAQTINVQTVTSSIVYSSGSNIFGNLLGDSQKFTGSVLITGSLTNVGTSCFTGTTTIGSDILLTAANPFVYGGTAVGGAGISNNTGASYIKIYGASHATLPNRIQFVNEGSTSLLIDNVGAACFASNVCALNLVSRCNIRVGVDGGYSVISGPTTGAAISLGSNSATFDRNLSLGLVDGSLAFNPILTINAQTANVGIGMCTPDRRLYVTDTSVTQGTFLAYNQCSTFCGTVIEGITDRTSNSVFNLMNLKSSTTSMFIVRGDGFSCHAGQVCVPTLIASSCLAVRAGTATVVINAIAGAASNNHLTLQRNDSQYASIGLNGSDNFTIFGTSTSSPRLTIDGSGNIGIGIISPAELLEIAGSLKIGNLKIQNVNGGSIGFNRNTSNGAIYNCCYAAFQINGPLSGTNYLDFQNYNSSGSYLGSFVFKDGCIGIGTTNPTGTYGKLSVAGGISILDDNTAKLEIGRYSSGVPNSYIKMGTNACSLKFTNNIDSIDLVTIEKCGAVLINTACKNYLGTPNRYGIEVNGGTGGVIYALNISNTAVGYIFHDNTNLSIYNDKSGGPVYVGPRFNNMGLQEQVFVGKMGGTTATSWDFCSFEEGGEGQVYKVEATFAHFAGWSYNTFYEGYAAARGTTVNTIDICNYATAQAGYFTVMKPTGAIFRVCKIAGSYGGTGWYWIKVTAVGPGF